VSSPRTHAADPHRRQYRFGDFTLDLDDGFLRRGAEEVALRPKTFEVLIYLVERHGRLVTKAELIDAIWPDAAVTDNSLAQCLAEIRRALADDSQQSIRTVARRGYLFAAPMTAAPLRFTRAGDDRHDASLVTATQEAVVSRSAGKPRPACSSCSRSLSEDSSWCNRRGGREAISRTRN
jgi:DNA-binding winged helix-turn-helix (wHTH) protein